jgi:hypothetical protein
MQTVAKDLGKWTTEELLVEVLARSTGNRPALDRLQTWMMRALLDECDRQTLERDAHLA